MSVIQAVIKNVIAEVIQSVLGVSLQYILNPARNSYAFDDEYANKVLPDNLFWVSNEINLELTNT
jgi:hypothetical protein